MEQAEHHFRRYEELMREQKEDEAWLNLEQAIEKDPNNLEYLWEYCDILFRQERYKLVIENITKIIELDPNLDNLEKAHNRLAVAHEATGQQQELINDLDWLIDNGYGTMSHYLWRGHHRRKQGLIDKAIADFTIAHQLNPMHTGPLLRRGITYQRMGNYDMALSDFNQVLQLEKNPYELRMFHYIRAEIYLKLNKDQEALDDINAALRLAGKKNIIIVC